jgi:hypothetical protein
MRKSIAKRPSTLKNIDKDSKLKSIKAEENK